MSRQVLQNEKATKTAFNILDKNKDDRLTLDDFDDLFTSQGGTFDHADLWDQLLAEADTNNDGAISYAEFQAAMQQTLTKNLKQSKRSTKKNTKRL